jgi:F-type H+-transporting ATPase subunit delta
MRDSSIAKNYAEALLELARRAQSLDEWGGYLIAVSNAMANEPKLHNFLAAPQVSAVQKKAVLYAAFADSLPRPILRFLQKLVDNRRQLLIPEIAVQYANLVDEAEGRVHAQVTVARETSDAERDAIGAQLSRKLGKKVVPHLAVNPAILGGVIVRIGDTVMDGSVRRRLTSLRARLSSGAARS